MKQAIPFVLFVAAALCGTDTARAQSRVLGSPGCGVTTTSCHGGKENAWWSKDKHHASIDLLYDNQKRVDEIAGKYGLASDDVFNGKKSNCMSCHGTVVFGKESEVDEPVSCESCHGPGSAYKEPHVKGYDLGVASGMAKLKDLKVRSEACVRCHYVVDQKLLAAGHPSGANFDYGLGMRKVSAHWKRAIVSPETDPAAFQQAKAKRGPVGKTPPPPAPPPAPKQVAAAVAPTPGAATPPSGGTAPATPPAPVAPTTAAPERVAPSAPPPPSEYIPPPSRAASPGSVVPAASEPVSVVLPPRPAVADSASVRELLLVVKKRLEQLYGQIGR